MTWNYSCCCNIFLFIDLQVFQLVRQASRVDLIISSFLLNTISHDGGYAIADVKLTQYRLHCALMTGGARVFHEKLGLETLVER